MIPVMKTEVGRAFEFSGYILSHFNAVTHIIRVVNEALSYQFLPRTISMPLIVLLSSVPIEITIKTVRFILFIVFVQDCVLSSSL